MEKFQETTKKIVELLCLNEPSLNFDTEGRKVNIFVNEGEWLENWTASLIKDLERVFGLVAKQLEADGVFVDVNSYRKKRENLIIELARASARKVSSTKESVELPVMNAYERRLVHVELAGRPDVATESIGDRADRRVVVKVID